MIGSRTLALAVMMIPTIVATGPPSAAQEASPAPQPGSIAASIVLDRSHFAVGEKPLLLITIKNVWDRKICVSLGSPPYEYRLHVSGRDGEPPQTEYQRHLNGVFRPGDGPDLPITVSSCTEIAPPMFNFDGVSVVFKFNLAAYYDLSAPGRYSVYLEVHDPVGPQDGAGIWVRTNTAQFEVEAKKP
jgi:hypothetical protein